MNGGFLEKVARLFWERENIKVKDYTFVFSNRRAGLFFLKYLSKSAEKALFSPRILTINQVFEEHTHMQRADQIDLLFRLYDIYKDIYLNINHLSESFDDFLFWGKMMLHDFSEIDQQLIDAKQLYSNLSDLKDIEKRFEVLSLEQQNSISDFVQGFSLHQSNPYRQKFISLWNSMGEIYCRFSKALLDEGIAYDGLLQRQVLEKFKPKDKHYVFVGFNALTQTERRLMQLLKNEGKAEFCWDYAADFMRDSHNRASMFMEDNVNEFGNLYDEKISSMPKIVLYKTPSSIGQAALAGQLIKQVASCAEDLTRVAVIMPDEKLLQPMLSFLPGNIEKVNVTMGQILQQTPVYSFFQLLSQLLTQQTKQGDALLYYYKPVMGILKHPYVVNNIDTTPIIEYLEKNNITYVPIKLLTEYPQLKLIFEPCVTTNETLERFTSLIEFFAGKSKEDNEYLYQAYTIVNRLTRLIDLHKDTSIQQKTLFSIFLQLLASSSVALEGEPLEGLQIMGVLESRALDFSTIFITDVNDEILPGNNSINSFIPSDLRRYYGLATIERQDAIHSYNFYRLISNADNILLMQNTISDDFRSGEVSRYIRQLVHQYGINIETVEIQQPIVSKLGHAEPIKIEKTDAVIEEIMTQLCLEHDNLDSPDGQNQSKLPKGLSPSALNDYVSCPVKFYLMHIKRLQQADHIEETLADNHFGNILHIAMQRLYADHTQITEQTIGDMILQLRTTDLVEKIYAEEYLKQTGEYHLEGKDYLPIRVLRKYIERVLEHDKTLCPFRYIASEKSLRTLVDVNGKRVLLKGIIDRIDQVGDKIRIVDYKTGAVHSDFPLYSNLFTSSSALKSDHVRQTLNYSLLYASNHQPTNPMEAHIYYVRYPQDKMDVVIKDKSSKTDFRSMKEEYMTSLIDILKELLESREPFVAIPNEYGTCRYCPFKFFCS